MKIMVILQHIFANGSQQSCKDNDVKNKMFYIYKFQIKSLMKKLFINFYGNSCALSESTNT